MNNDTPVLFKENLASCVWYHSDSKLFTLINVVFVLVCMKTNRQVWHLVSLVVFFYLRSLHPTSLT